MSSYRQGPPTAISVPPERPKAAPRPCLLFLAGSDVGRSVELSAEAIEIGRSEECAVSVTSDGVSRRHAKVQKIFGLYFVTDLESTNGTFVNEQRIQQMAQLNDGDRIRVGDLVLKFVLNHLEVEYTQQVSSLAAADSLTGTFAKAHFDLVFIREAERATRSGTPLCLILFDLDHFKAINDGYGHAAGDAVLAQTAAVVKGALSAEQPFGRVGGEEFAILLPNTALGVALALAERIRNDVARAAFSHLGRTITVTVSLGVAELVPGESSERLFARADERLYSSKRGGRNRVSSS
jgi:two-component system, cell cycle response regulator